MYNDYGGGWWAGYDQGKDQLILVASNDARRDGGRGSRRRVTGIGGRGGRSGPPDC